MTPDEREEPRIQIQAALSFLATEGGLLPKARAVFENLFDERELSGDDLHNAVLYLAAWMEANQRPENARTVLPLALGRLEDMETDDANLTADLSIFWLHKYRCHPLARFVLKPLLECTDLAWEHAEPLIDLALAWLRRNGTLPQASHVLVPLLQRRDPRDILGYNHEQAARRWLETNPEAEGVGRVEDALQLRKDHPRPARPGGSFRHMRELEYLLTSGEPPAEELVRGAIAEARRFLHDGNHGAAARYASALLPLVYKTEAWDLQKDVVALAAEVRERADVDTHVLMGFFYCNERLLDRGTWRDPEKGSQVLEELDALPHDWW